MRNWIFWLKSFFIIALLRKFLIGTVFCSYSVLLLEAKDEEGQIQVLSAAVEVVIAVLYKMSLSLSFFSAISAWILLCFRHLFFEPKIDVVSLIWFPSYCTSFCPLGHLASYFTVILMLCKAVLCCMLMCCLFQWLYMQMADAQEADVEVRFRGLVALGTLVYFP